MYDNDNADGERGLSPVIGVLLLLAVVLVAVTMILLLGGQTVEEAQKTANEEAAQKSMVKLRGQLEAMNNKQGRQNASVDLPGRGRVNATPGGKLVVAVNGMSTCSATVDLSKIRYNLSTGQTLVHQGGAVFQVDDEGQTSMLTTPGVQYAQGRLRLSITNASTTIRDDGSVTLTEQNSSALQTALNERLDSERKCYRPDYVILRVTSDYHRQWYRFLKREMPGSTVADGRLVHLPGSETVRVNLTEPELLEVSNDSLNRVVNFTDSDPHSGTVVDENPAPSGPDNYIEVDKRPPQADNHSYNVGINVFDVTVGYNTTLTHTEVRYNNSTVKQPLDVVFVMDDSGSMSGSKIADAANAVHGFIDQIDFANGSRAGLVRFDWWYSTRQHLTTSESQISSAVNDYRHMAGGGTNIDEPIKAASDNLYNNGDPDHEQVMIVLTDGKGDIDGAVGDYGHAAEAADRNITIYTIGVGGSVDKAELKEIANRTNGSYFPVADADNLDSVFDAIRRDVNKKTVEVVDARYVINNKINVSTNRTRQGYVNISTGDGVDYFNESRGDGLQVSDGEKLIVESVAIDKCTSHVKTNETSTIMRRNDSGVLKAYTYHHRRCVDTKRVTVNTTKVHMLTDGDELGDYGDNWYWSEDVKNSIPDKYVDGNEVNVSANQVVVIANTTYKGNSQNVAMLITIGNDPADIVADPVVEIEVSKVKEKDD